MSQELEAPPRREFLLPEEDAEFLDSRFPRWETLSRSGTQWLMIYDAALPSGFLVDSATLAIRIIPGYPTAALDMVYVSPPLARRDGKAIPALAPTSIDGCVFQQWSRHYSSAHPWRPDIDNIESHLRAIEEWFQRALR